MIVNALYFNAKWANPFPTRATVDEAFEVTPGRTVKVPFMRQRTDVAYKVSDGCRAVDIAYEGGDFSMSVIVPDERCALADLERRLTPELLHRLTDSASDREVDVELPRFKIRTFLTDLTDALRGTGLTLPFDSARADFSGINGLRGPDERAVHISNVLQQAFVSTSEAGTEASAATVVQVAATSSDRPEKPPEIPRFKADHPFLFAIRDWRSGAILFLGRVIDPSHS